MSCSPPSWLGHSRRLDLDQDQTDALDPVEIDGTWDFKWRKDAIIRVAFQTPPGGEEGARIFQHLVPRVIEVARRWKTRIRIDSRSADPPQSVPLTLHFLPNQPLLAAPPPVGIGIGDAVLYDVLISLAPLPVLIPKSHKRPEQKVFLPRSELGRYARRLEYGTPTAFLGVRPGRSWASFSETPEWEHTVLHEFGHILGLAHPFQQHNSRVDWKEDAELKKILPGLLDLDLSEDETQDFIHWQLKARLPSPAALPNAVAGGGPYFSDDWEDVSAPSVMNPPFMHKLMSRTGTAIEDGWRVSPTEADHAHLHAMYFGRN